MWVELVILLNRMAGAVADVAFAPIAWVPGWLSSTVIAGLTGIGMLVLFKHTSNQAAIKQTRNDIKANLLALSLFKDELRVGLHAQVGLLAGSVRLLVLSLVPMLVMFVPGCLLLGQMALWYQVRPLRIGEEAVVTMKLSESAKVATDVELADAPGVTTTIGPVRVPAKNMICWNIRATGPGCHRVTFMVEGRPYTKEVAVGEGYMPTSVKRPGWNVYEAVLHPREEPFSKAVPVRSIEVAFPSRASWTAGTDRWLIYWLIVSMLTAFILLPLLNVTV